MSTNNLFYYVPRRWARASLGCVVLAIAILGAGGCAGAPDTNDRPGGERFPAATEERASGAGLYFTPWPAPVDDAFLEGAFLTSDWITLSHPAGWRFREVGPFELTVLPGKSGVASRIAVFPWNRTDTNLPEGSTGETVTPEVARFLQWVTALPGEVVFSDETVNTMTPAHRPIYVAIVSSNGGVARESEARGLVWQSSRSWEIVIEYTGSLAVVQEVTQGMIQTAKTVTVPAAAGDSRGVGGSSRRLSSGLTFQGHSNDADRGWTWHEDLADGFVVAYQQSPNEVFPVAVWGDGDQFSFEVRSDTEPPEAALRALLTEQLEQKGVTEVVR